MEPKHSVMVLAEIRSQKVHELTLEMIAWGRKLADKLGVPVDCVVLGIEQADFQKLVHWGADRVLVVTNGRPDSLLATPAARLLVETIRAEQPGIVIAPATTFGRTIMPITAARLATGLTADCTELDIDPKDNLLLQTRPAIGGNIMATIKTARTKPQMATVRPRSIKPGGFDPTSQGEVIIKHYDTGNAWQETLLSFMGNEENDINLENADIVVSGGKGMKSKENYQLLEELAGLLGAGLGATRDAVEAGWAPFARQVGLTGKTVSPKVYLAAGVSGKIQHLAGILTSEYIIAINEDADSQIFKVADLGIIGDAPTVVTCLIQAFKDLKTDGKEHENG
ncbi:MAG: electron transfer flavoprotein subunit alpha [Peptococcaceae bacterium BRH_c8a]|nr:MAG: electron transfer flavoprotein subunit alpha [Peptococcaceae bacterium BRH_c8a]